MRSYSQIRLTDPEQSMHARCDTLQHAARRPLPYRTPPRHPKKPSFGRINARARVCSDACRRAAAHVRSAVVIINRPPTLATHESTKGGSLGVDHPPARSPRLQPGHRATRSTGSKSKITTARVLYAAWASGPRSISTSTGPE